MEFKRMQFIGKILITAVISNVIASETEEQGSIQGYGILNMNGSSRGQIIPIHIANNRVVEDKPMHEPEHHHIRSQGYHEHHCPDPITESSTDSSTSETTLHPVDHDCAAAIKMGAEIKSPMVTGKIGGKVAGEGNLLSSCHDKHGTIELNAVKSLSVSQGKNIPSMPQLGSISIKEKISGSIKTGGKRSNKKCDNCENGVFCDKHGHGNGHGHGHGHGHEHGSDVHGDYDPERRNILDTQAQVTMRTGGLGLNKLIGGSGTHIPVVNIR